MKTEDIKTDKDKICKNCKYYKEGLSIDYVPGHYCDLNVTDKNNCQYFDDNYTVWDWFEECWFGIVVVIFVLIMNLLFN